MPDPAPNRNTNFRTGQNRPLPTRPRKVRNGCKLSVKPERLGASPIGKLWLDWVRASVRDEESFEEGTAYAKSGQVIEFEIGAGSITARVQGRRGKPYEWRLNIGRFEPADCDRLIDAVALEARFAAGLDAVELAQALPEVSASLGLTLIPEPGDPAVKHSCSCQQFEDQAGKPRPGWCKHGVAVGLILTEAIDADPAQAWRLRGIDTLELSDRVRLKRSIESGAGPLTAHQSGDALLGSEATLPLDAAIDSFYDLSPAIAGFETRLQQADVSHVLLRRLGPSPMGQRGRFPIIGLLATCYELVSQHVLAEQIDAGPPDDDEDEENTVEPETPV